MKLSKFTKKLDNDFKFVIRVFLIWKVALLGVLFLSLNYLSLAGKNFLGGGLENYLKNPLLFAWANFDGEHYLSIAQIGYHGLEQAFFPVYPSLMNILSKLFSGSTLSLVTIGLLISNISFLLALLVLFKLIKIDFSEKVAKLTIVVIFTFPTSFYFGAVYSESIFLLFIVSSFYLIRQKRWFLGSILGSISSATRVFGLILLPSFLLEVWQNKQNLKNWFWIFLIPSGLVCYIIYQWIWFNDPLAFYHLQKIVGPQHESGVTLIPQIYFRYIKILLTTPFSNPIYQTIILELLVGIAFFVLPFIGLIKKVRLSYLLFALLAFILPTVQGSFSSLPRYVLVLFPSFLCIALLLEKYPSKVKIAYLLISSIVLAAEASLFFRGYWVA